VIAAAVEDDLASLTSNQALLGFAGVALLLRGRWCTDGAVCNAYLLDLLW
jgi:hypothetical protein